MTTEIQGKTCNESVILTFDKWSTGYWMMSYSSTTDHREIAIEKSIVYRSWRKYALRGHTGKCSDREREIGTCVY